MFDRYFTFNGRSSKDFNLVIQNDFEINDGDADVSYTSVPGRNVDIVNSNNRYKNGTITYECFVDIRHFKHSYYDDLALLRRDLIYWLQVKENFSGYATLYDNMDNEYFYLARLAKSPVMTFIGPKVATIAIEFNLGSEKYRVAGNSYRSIKSGDTLFNPEPMTSYPIIKIEGTGPIDVTLNGYIYKITEIGGTAYIDSSRRRVYDDNKLKNSIAVFPNYRYPFLESGNNEIVWNNASAKVSIQMNWRALL